MFYAWFWEPWVKQTWTIQMWPGTIPFAVSRAPNPGARSLYYACGVNGFNIPVSPTCHFFVLQLPSGFRRPLDDRFNFIPVRKTQAGARRAAACEVGGSWGGAAGRILRISHPPSCNTPSTKLCFLLLIVNNFNFL